MFGVARRFLSKTNIILKCNPKKNDGGYVCVVKQFACYDAVYIYFYVYKSVVCIRYRI